MLCLVAVQISRPLISCENVAEFDQHERLAAPVRVLCIKRLGLFRAVTRDQKVSEDVGVDDKQGLTATNRARKR